MRAPQPPDPARPPETTAARKVVAECVDVILDPLSFPGDLHAAINRLADHFAGLAGFHHDATLPAVTGSEIHLPSGTAISPHEAATCLRDIRRTTAFLQGIHQAIRHLLETRTERPIQVLYAGCGPFATLVTPLLHRFGPRDIRVCLLDIQPECLASARRLIESLGHQDFLGDCLLQDAATYQNYASPPCHLVITETMQAALEKECHVSIAANLSAHLDAGGIMIPGRIMLEAVLLDPAWEFSVERMRECSVSADHRIALGTAFELDLESAREIRRNHGPDFSEDIRVPGRELGLPADIPPMRDVWIMTAINTYGDIWIQAHDSGLTIPRPAKIQPAPSAGDRVAFSYVMGHSPHLRGETLPR